MTAASAHRLPPSRATTDDDVSMLRERSGRGASLAGTVRPEIAESWCRSRDRYRVGAHLSAAPEAETSAHFSMDQVTLFAELAGRVAARETEAGAAGAVIALSDGMGRVVGTWSDGTTLRRASRRNLAPRSCWSERAIGTNGLGLALESDEMITVRGAEHWCTGFSDWSSVAVALRDRASGRPVAALMICSWGHLPPLAATWISEIVQGARAAAPIRVVGMTPAASGPGRTRPRDPDTVGAGATEVHGSTPVPRSGVRRPIGPMPARRATPAPKHTDDEESFQTAGANASAMPRRVVGTKDHRQVLFAADEVAVAEAAGRIVWLVTDRGRLRCATDSLEKLEHELTGTGFMRVHRRYLVNLARVREVERKDGGELALIIDRGANSIPVSRRRATLVSRALGL